MTQATPTNAKGMTMTINKINAVCQQVYECGLLAIDPLAALWLAERIFAEHGVNVYSKISAHRNKYGSGTVFPEYGTPLFCTLTSR